MLTQLPTLKSRLAILESDTQYDALLTTAAKPVSALPHAATPLMPNHRISGPARPPFACRASRVKF